METVNNNECCHGSNLTFVKAEPDCSTFDSRGSGQYNDPCYGASCPCDGYHLIDYYQCKKCGNMISIRK